MSLWAALAEWFFEAAAEAGWGQAYLSLPCWRSLDCRVLLMSSMASSWGQGLEVADAGGLPEVRT